MGINYEHIKKQYCQRLYSFYLNQPSDEAFEKAHNVAIKDDVPMRASKAKRHLRKAYILAGIYLTIGLIFGFGAVSTLNLKVGIEGDKVLILLCFGALFVWRGINSICCAKTCDYRRKRFCANPRYFIEAYERAKQQREKNKKIREQQAAERAEREQKIAEKERKIAEKAEKERKDRVHLVVQKMNGQRSDTIESGGRLLDHAERVCSLLEKVKTDLMERAFAPFWDNICGAAAELGRMEARARSMARCHKEYIELGAEYSIICQDGDIVPDPFEKGLLNPLGDRQTIADLTAAFRVIVRTAQKDFEFASIYEHYRTREVLVEGFGSLADAIDCLSEGIGRGFRELQICFEEQQEATRQAIFDAAEEIIDAAEEREERAEKRHGEMLASNAHEHEADREAAAAGFEDHEEEQQRRHDEVIVEYERSHQLQVRTRKLVRDIDRQLGGNEWRRQ